MRKLPQIFGVAGLALIIASCGSNTVPDTQSHAASSNEVVIKGAGGPFAAAEMSMNEKMMSAVGANVSDTWLKQMIEHHRGAIAMSKIVLEQHPSGDARMMAEQTIAMQGKEIDELTRLLSKSPADPASLEPYRPAGSAMHDAMMAAGGADASETYFRKMLEHHRGAIALSDVVIKQGTDPRVRAAAQKTKTVQAKEASMIEAMLARKPMAMSGPMSKSAPGTPASNAGGTSPSSKPRTEASKAGEISTPTPSSSDMKGMPGMTI